MIQWKGTRNVLLENSKNLPFHSEQVGARKKPEALVQEQHLSKERDRGLSIKIVLQCTSVSYTGHSARSLARGGRP